MLSRASEVVAGSHAGLAILVPHLDPSDDRLLLKAPSVSDAMRLDHEAIRCPQVKVSIFIRHLPHPHRAKLFDGHAAVSPFAADALRRFAVDFGTAATSHVSLIVRPRRISHDGLEFHCCSTAASTRRRAAANLWASE